MISPLNAGRQVDAPTRLRTIATWPGRENDSPVVEIFDKDDVGGTDGSGAWNRFGQPAGIPREAKIRDHLASEIPDGADSGRTRGDALNFYEEAGEYCADATGVHSVEAEFDRISARRVKRPVSKCISG